MKVLYTAEATATGREGRVRSTDVTVVVDPAPEVI